MDKYYVICGQLQWLGMAKTPRAACVLAVHFFKDIQFLDDKFYVDKRGFRWTHPLGFNFQDLGILAEDDNGKAAHVYDTAKILEIAGLDNS